jgi:hypothetical protein
VTTGVAKKLIAGIIDMRAPVCSFESKNTELNIRARYNGPEESANPLMKNKTFKFSNSGIRRGILVKNRMKN